MRPAGSKGGFTIVRKVQPFSLFSNVNNTFSFLGDTAGIIIGPNFQIGTPVVLSGAVSVFDVPFSMAFTLSNLVGFTDLTAIADRYRINKVWVRFFFNYQSASTTDTPVSATPAPMIEYIQDHDDNTPDTVLSFRERMGTKMKIPRNNGYIQVAVNPSILMQSSLGSDVIKFGQYLDTNAPTVLHYGLKGTFKNMPGSDQSVFPLCRIDIAYSVSVKNLQ